MLQKTSVHLHLSGNAASQRGNWSVNTFANAFAQSKPHPDLRWEWDVDGENAQVHISARDPAPIVGNFVRFVESMIKTGLNGYDHVKIFISCEDVDDIISVYVRSVYGMRNAYRIIVQAPSCVQETAGSFSFLFETMETLPHWDVNSIAHFARIPNGVLFQANESDACTMASYLTDEIRSEIPDVLHDHPDTLVDILVAKSRRGNTFILQVGLEWRDPRGSPPHPIEWGPTAARLPVSTEPPVRLLVPDDVCSICLEPFRQDLFRTGCQHLFHRNCMNDMWHATSSPRLTCPLCRDPVFKLERVVVVPPVSKRKPSTPTIADRVKKRKL